jgi:hypothetical protein
MTEGAQPLLPPDDPGAGDAESAALGVPDAAEAGRPRVSVASLLAVEPGQAIDILEQHGVVTLGSMTVKVGLMLCSVPSRIQPGASSRDAAQDEPVQRMRAPLSLGRRACRGKGRRTAVL